MAYMPPDPAELDPMSAQRRIGLLAKRKRVGMGDVQASPNSAVEEPVAPAFGQMGAVQASPNSRVGGEYPAQTGARSGYEDAQDSGTAPSRDELVRLRQMKLAALRAAEGGARNSIMANNGNRNFTQPALDAREQAQRELRDIDEAMAGMDRKGSLYETPGQRLAKQKELANQIQKQGGRDPRAEANDFFTTQRPDLLGMGTGELDQEQTDRLARRESLLAQDGPGSIRHSVMSMRAQEKADAEAAATEAKLAGIGNQTILKQAEGGLLNAEAGADRGRYDAERGAAVEQANLAAIKARVQGKSIESGTDAESMRGTLERDDLTQKIKAQKIDMALKDSGIGDVANFVSTATQFSGELGSVTGYSGLGDSDAEAQAKLGIYESQVIQPLERLAASGPEGAALAQQIAAQIGPAIANEPDQQPLIGASPAGKAWSAVGLANPLSAPIVGARALVRGGRNAINAMSPERGQRIQSIRQRLARISGNAQ